MGMAGMAADAYAKYASASEKKAEVPSTANQLSTTTVAEYRNMVNPMTKYYDMWSIDSFVKDQSIPAKKKIEVLCGKLVADCIDESVWNLFFSKIAKV